MNFRRLVLLVTYLIVVLLLIACSSEGNATGNKDEKTILTVAYDNKPPGLDPHITTATITRDFSSPIFETLVL